MRAAFAVFAFVTAIVTLTPCLASAETINFSGRASYYDQHYKGKTASGEIYDPQKLTAAHRTLPFGTKLKVTDRRTQRTVIVVVNDRGPFTRNVVLDLSYAAAKSLNMIARGVVPIEAAPAASE